MRVPMQLQMVNYRAASLDNSLVLVGINFGEFLGENLLDVPAEKFLFIAATATINQGLIDGDVTAASIFDEESSVGNVIEELLDDG